MLNKKAQESFGISYGVIFSIILIIVIIGVAFYAISNFLSINECSETGFFYDDLQKEIDKAWTSDQYRDSFKGGLPFGIEKVCLGNLTQTCGSDCAIRNEFASIYSSSGSANIFLYPPEKACENRLFSNVLSHVNISEFFCIDADNDKVEIKLEKMSSDVLVRVI